MLPWGQEGEQVQLKHAVIVLLVLGFAAVLAGWLGIFAVAGLYGAYLFGVTRMAIRTVRELDQNYTLTKKKGGSRIPVIKPISVGEAMSYTGDVRQPIEYPPGWKAHR
jgi:hypothetical protein